MKTIVETLREYDLIGRYGGEEFVVLMPNTDRESAVAVAERARRAPLEQRGIDANGTTFAHHCGGGVADSTATARTGTRC